VTEHERRLKELEQIYERHTVLVRDFAAPYRPNEKLVEIQVDDNNVRHQLARVLYDLDAAAADDTVVISCWQYNAEALDYDWKDFSRPV